MRLFVLFVCIFFVARPDHCVWGTPIFLFVVLWSNKIDVNNPIFDYECESD